MTDLNFSTQHTHTHIHTHTHTFTHTQTHTHTCLMSSHIEYLEALWGSVLEGPEEVGDLDQVAYECMQEGRRNHHHPILWDETLGLIEPANGDLRD